VPAYAARLLTLREDVRYLTRPRLLPLYMLVFIVAVVLGVVVFSLVIKDPEFMRLLTIPAIPVLGGVAGYLVHFPVILVTNSRVISASRFSKPLSLDLEKLEALRIKRNRLGRLIGHGTLVLLVQPPRDLGEGVFLRFELKKVPDAPSLSSAILAAARALGNYGDLPLPRRGNHLAI
jgi:hypothetical protein